MNNFKEPSIEHINWDNNSFNGSFLLESSDTLRDDKLW